MYLVNRRYKRLAATEQGEQKILLVDAWEYEKRVIEEERNELLTETVRKKANRLYVMTPPKPVPPRHDDIANGMNWGELKLGAWISGIVYLIEKGAKEVRIAIAEEVKRRRDGLLPWLAISRV